MTAHAHVEEHFAGTNKLFTWIWVWLVGTGSLVANTIVVRKIPATAKTETNIKCRFLWGVIRSDLKMRVCCEGLRSLLRFFMGSLCWL